MKYLNLLTTAPRTRIYRDAPGTAPSQNLSAETVQDPESKEAAPSGSELLEQGKAEVIGVQQIANRHDVATTNTVAENLQAQGIVPDADKRINDLSA